MKYIKHLLWFCLLFICAADFPIKPDITVKQLDNGLTILYWHIPSSPAIAIRGYVLTGSMYEKEHLGDGISHYLEHLVSSGTTSKRTEKEYQRLERLMGGVQNAYTTNDETCYHITTTPEYFELADSMLFEWLTDCSFDEKEVKRERSVITQEIKKNQVILEEPIKELGEYQIKLALEEGLEPQITVVVVAEENSKKEEEL